MLCNVWTSDPVATDLLDGAAIRELDKDSAGLPTITGYPTPRLAGTASLA